MRNTKKRSNTTLRIRITETQMNSMLEATAQSAIQAYHGSQTEIKSKEGFSTKYILSGEGTNYFGWGLYFTDIVDIAKSYARNNTANEFNRFLSVPTDFVGTNINDVIDFFEMQDQWDSLPKGLKTLLIQNRNTGKTTEDLIDKGYLYSVEITPSKPMAFDWYGEMTQEELNNLGYSHEQPMEKSIFYKKLIKELGSDKEASLFLYSKGYFGVTYPTGTILTGEHTNAGTNYVIFNEKDIHLQNVERL